MSKPVKQRLRPVIYSYLLAGFLGYFVIIGITEGPGYFRAHIDREIGNSLIVAVIWPWMLCAMPVPFGSRHFLIAAASFIGIGTLSFWVLCRAWSGSTK
jgi:hypothetical protein